MHHGQDRGQDGLRGARRDGDLAVGRIVVPVQRADFGGHGLAQGQHARHGRVLVLAGLHGERHGAGQRRITVEIGEALPEVDRAMARGQCRHDGKYSGAHAG